MVFLVQKIRFNDICRKKRRTRNNDNGIMAVKTSATQDSQGKTAHKSENHSEDYTELEADYQNVDYESLYWNFKKF